MIEVKVERTEELQDLQRDSHGDTGFGGRYTCVYCLRFASLFVLEPLHQVSQSQQECKPLPGCQYVDWIAPVEGFQELAQRGKEGARPKALCSLPPSLKTGFGCDGRTLLAQGSPTPDRQ